MKYKALMIDMDYCADPIWVSNDPDNEGFANGCISEFENVLSKGLLQSLEVYRSLWEKAHWTEYVSPTEEELSYPCIDLVFDLLSDMVPVLANALKDEIPSCRVFYRNYEDSIASLVEVSERRPRPKGIWPTLVG